MDKDACWRSPAIALTAGGNTADKPSIGDSGDKRSCGWHTAMKSHRITSGSSSNSGDTTQGHARWVTPRGQQQPLRVTADKDQVSATLERVDQPGDYMIEVEASQAGRSLGKARANFQVLDRDAELSNPAANYDLMARLAGLTKEAGGSPVAPEQLPELLREIKRRRPDLRIEVQSRWQLADTALDAWLFLLVFLGLVTTEWALRKRWGLV